MSEPLLEIEDVTIQYETNEGPLTAVSNVSFEVNNGEYYGLVGESGCGKSTLLKGLLGGLDENGKIQSGKVKYQGQEIQDYSDKELSEHIRWKEIAWIPQGSMSSLDPLERIDDQAVEIAQAHTDWDREKVVERLKDLFEIVGIQQSRIKDYPHQFSGGMEQRALIAFALLLEPKVLLADEPTTALDVIMQDQVFKYLDKIREEENTSMILVTHDISVVFESCDRMGIMHSGQMSERGTVEEVFDNPRHPYSIMLQKAFPDVRYPDRDLDVIQGAPPQNFGEVGDCTFADRCPWAEEECRISAPQDRDIDNPGHQVACFRADEDLQGDLDE